MVLETDITISDEVQLAHEPVPYIFDLDGTLVDTKSVVLQAYRSVGVEPPLDFFGRAWYEWLHDAELHRKKNLVYISLIPMVRPLPLMKLFKEVTASIMTGASGDAAMAICDHFDLSPHWTRCSMSLDSKIKALNRMPPGIFFEDSLHAVERMRKETEWMICHAPCLYQQQATEYASNSKI